MAYMRIRVAAALFGLSMIVALGCIDKPGTDGSSSESKPASKSSDPAGGSGSGIVMTPGSGDSPSDLVDINMTVAEFTVEAKKNTADAKFGGRYIAVTGPVEWYGHTKDKTPYFVMAGSDLPFICTEGHLAQKALPGQKTVLRGKWIAPKHGVEAWTIMSVDSNTSPLNLQAVSLAQRIAVTPKGAAEQYGIYKSIMINGKIADINTNGALLLTPVGQVPKILCWLNPDTLNEPGKVEFKVGQDVLLIGWYDALGKGQKIWEFVRFGLQ